MPGGPEQPVLGGVELKIGAGVGQQGQFAQSSPYSTQGSAVVPHEVDPPFIGSVTQVYTPGMAPGEIFPSFIASSTQVYTPGTSRYALEVLADSPTAYYRLNESSGTLAADSSGNGNNGTYEGTRTQGATGLLSGTSDAAVSFTGAGDVAIPSGIVALATSTSALTLECWFKTTDGGNNCLIADRVAGSGALLTMWVQSGVIHFDLRDNSGSGLVQRSISDTTVNDGVRHHLVAARDTSKVWRVYLDGTIVDKFQDGMTTACNAGTTHYLARELSSGYLNGTLDEVAIYTGQTLTAARVRDHYTAGSEEPISADTTDTYGNQIINDGATAYYRLGEQSGTIRAVDCTGNGYHGARRIGATISGTIVPTCPDGATAVNATADGRVDLPLNDFLDSASDSLSLEIWFRQPTSANAALITGRNPTNSNPVLDLTIGFNGNQYSGTGTVTLYTRDNAGGALIVELNSGYSVGDNVTHHAVLTRDGSDKKWRIYVDGVLQTASASADSISAITNIDYFSVAVERFSSTIGKLNGTVDEVAIYKGLALSAAQVLNHYNLGVQASVPFIVSHTTVYTPSVPQVNAPFIPSVTVVYAPTLPGQVPAPFISSVTVVYTPSLPEVNVPFIGSSTHVWHVMSMFDPNLIFGGGAGNGGESFVVRLAPNGASHTATLTSNLSATGRELDVTGDGAWPSDAAFVVTIDTEVILIIQRAPGVYQIRLRGLSNTTASTHTAGASAVWTDTYDQAIVAASDIAHNFTADIASSGSYTYPGWLVCFDSTQAYLSGDRYPFHVTELLGVFDAASGSSGTSRLDAAQPNAISTATGTSDDCGAALSNPARIQTDIITGDVAVVRYTNPEAAELDLGPRSVALQSWFGLKRVSTSDADVTFTNPNGIVVDTTGTYDTFTGSVNGEWADPVPLITGIAPDASHEAGVPIDTPNPVPYTTVTLDHTDRFFTIGSGAGGYDEKGWPFGVLAVRQGNRRVPYWESWDWHNFSYVYCGFGTDNSFAQIVINRNGIIYGSIPSVDLPGDQDITGPDAVWDDGTYYFGVSWYVAIFAGPYLVYGPTIGGETPPIPPGGPVIPGVTFPPGGGPPVIIPPGTEPPPPVEGGSGGGIEPSLSGLHIWETGGGFF